MEDYPRRRSDHDDHRRRQASSSRRQSQEGRASRSRNRTYDQNGDARARQSARASSASRQSAAQGAQRPRRHAATGSSRESVHSARHEHAQQQTRARSQAASGPQVRQHARQQNSSLRRNTVSPFGYTEGQGSRPFSYADNNPIGEGFSLGIDSGSGGNSSWRSQGTYATPYRRKTPWIPILIGVVALALIGFFAFGAVKGCSAGGGKAAQQNEDKTMAVSEKTAPVTQKITLTFAGDCTLGTDENFSYEGGFTAKYAEVGDPNYFLANVRPLFESDDATIVNMEGTLTTSTSRADKTYAFKAPAEYVSILTGSSVEAASLANNHSRDYGEQSYTDTINTMEAAGIPTFGYDRVALLDVKGVKVGLVGSYFPGDSEQREQETIDGIKKAREEGAQVVIVYAHWGIERAYVPDSDQTGPAHRFVEAGADFVVGSHPHVIQGCETYNGTNIVYSLGNFCFGGNPNPSDKDCMMVQKTFTITDGKLVPDDNLTIIPCSVSSVSSHNNYQPEILSGSRADEVMAKINESSRSISSV